MRRRGFTLVELLLVIAIIPVLIGLNGVFPARSFHAGGVNAVMADASVLFLSNSIDLLTYQRLGGRNDGEAVAMP